MNKKKINKITKKQILQLTQEWIEKLSKSELDIHLTPNVFVISRRNPKN